MFETSCSPFSSLAAYQGKVARNIGCSTDRPLNRVNTTFNLQVGLGKWKTPTTCLFSHRCLNCAVGCRRRVRLEFPKNAEKKSEMSVQRPYGTQDSLFRQRDDG